MKYGPGLAPAAEIRPSIRSLQGPRALRGGRHHLLATRGVNTRRGGKCTAGAFGSTDFLGSWQGEGWGRGQISAPCRAGTTLSQVTVAVQGPCAECFTSVGSRPRGGDVITVPGTVELSPRKGKFLVQGHSWNVSEVGLEPGSSAPQRFTPNLCPLVGQAKTPGLAPRGRNVWLLCRVTS